MKQKLLASVTLGALFLGACGSPTASNLTHVKIGVVAPMSGDAASYGVELQRILDYRLEEVNEKAAKEGYEFELVYEDGKCDGSAANTAFQKLTDVESVQFIIGGVCSSESLAMVPLLKDKSAIALSPASSSPELTDASNRFYSLSYSDSDVSEEIARQLGAYDKVAIITEQNDFNTAMRDGVIEELKEKGVTVVADETVAKGMTDFRNTIQRVKAANPDVIFLNPNAGVTAEALVRQLAELPDWKVAKVSHFSLLPDELAAIAPEVMNGTIIVDTPAVSNEAFNEIYDAIVESKGTLDSLGKYYTASTLDALDLMTQLIILEEGDVEQVLDSLMNEEFQGFLGEISFHSNTFVLGIETANYVYEDGKVVPKE